jgi:hypothetical protein
MPVSVGILLAQCAVVFGGIVCLAKVAVVGAPILGFLLVLLMMRQIVSGGAMVNSPKITSITCLVGYLILAFSYAMAYHACAILRDPVVQQGNDVLGVWTLLYFSVISGATVGYGEMLPSRGWSRFLSATEALQFWLFLAWAVFAIQEAVRAVRVVKKRPARPKPWEPVPGKPPEDTLAAAGI